MADRRCDVTALNRAMIRTVCSILSRAGLCPPAFKGPPCSPQAQLNTSRAEQQLWGSDSFRQQSHSFADLRIWAVTGYKRMCCCSRWLTPSAISFPVESVGIKTYLVLCSEKERLMGNCPSLKHCHFSTISGVFSYFVQIEKSLFSSMGCTVLRVKMKEKSVHSHLRMYMTQMCYKVEWVLEICMMVCI